MWTIVKLVLLGSVFSAVVLLPFALIASRLFTRGPPRLKDFTASNSDKFSWPKLRSDTPFALIASALFAQFPTHLKDFRISNSEQFSWPIPHSDAEIEAELTASLEQFARKILISEWPLTPQHLEIINTPLGCHPK